MDQIARHIHTKAHALLEQFPVLVIIGARQVGKSVLAKLLRPDWKYFDLEKPADYDFISHDPAFFFEQYLQHIILDEAQLYPALFATLRGVIDSDRQKANRYIITGSSSSDLLHEISESLAGRVAIIELGTVKCSEYYRQELSDFYNVFSQKLDRRYLIEGLPPINSQAVEQIWLRGGYPEPLVKDNEFFYEQWTDNYQKTYINRDIAKLFPRLDKVVYRRFMTVLGHLSGKIINRSHLGRDLGISESTVKQYLEIAEGTFLWRSLQSFESNATKSVVKMPKGHLRDTSLIHYFLKISNKDDLLLHPLVGSSFEAFVIEEILKGLNATNATNWQAYYYRTRNGAEIDLILDGPFGLLPIEIKHNSSVKMQQLRSLTQFIDAHQLPFGLLINQAQETRWLTDKILQVPVGWI